MRKNFTFLYMMPALFLLAFSANAAGEKPVKDQYYYMRIDTSGVDVGYLRINNLNHRLTVDNKLDGYAQWKFLEYRVENGAPVADDSPNHYWLINRGSQDTLKFKAPVNHEDTTAFIDASGNLFRWEQLFLDANSGVDTLVASYQDVALNFHSFFLTLNPAGAVMLLARTSNLYPHLRFRLEKATNNPLEDRYYRINIDTLGATSVLGFLATDSSALNPDSLILDTAMVETDYAAWKFVVDTVINDTTYFRVYNKRGIVYARDSLLAFDIPTQDTVAVMNAAGDLNSWLIPYFAENGDAGKFMVRDTVSARTFYLGLEDSVVMLVNEASDIQLIRFTLSEEYAPVPPPPNEEPPIEEPPNEEPPIVEPLPEVDRFDSVQVYKVKMLSGAHAGYYWAIDASMQDYYTDSVYSHIPDGQFVVNKQNIYSLINRNVKAIVTDTFYFELGQRGDTIPDHFVYRSDTVEVKPIHYAPAGNWQDSLLGYKFFPQSYPVRKDSCFYIEYISTDLPPDSLNGRILGNGSGTDQNRQIQLLPVGDTARYFIEYIRTDTATAAPAGIAQLMRSVYYLRSQDDTTRYFSSNSPSQMGDYPHPNGDTRGLFLFKEEIKRGGYSLTVASSTNPFSFLQKFVINSDFTNPFFMSLNAVDYNSSTYSLFQFVKVEVPVYPDDEYQYLRNLPQGRGLYEIRGVSLNMEGKKLTKNFYDYTVFSQEGESVLKAGSYLPNDFFLWIDTARGPGSNRFRTSFFIIKDVDTTNLNSVQGSFLHVNDPTVSSSSDYLVDVGGIKYSRGNFVRAKRTASNTLQLSDVHSVGEGTDNPNVINEYRFYLQKTETDTTQYYLVTEKGYGGYPDSTGYFSYVMRDNNFYYYFGPRENNSNIVVKLVKYTGPVANEVVVAPPPSRPVLEEVAKKEIMVSGGTGWVSVENARGNRVQIYNIVGQLIANKVSASDNERINVPRGIAIVKIGKTITKKVVVR